ncbi:MAG: sulfatase-like hydrolase/transferase, partial [Myxococcota bacterium]
MFDAKSVLGRILAALVMPIGLSSGCSPDPSDGVVMRAGAPQESPERPGLVMIVSLDTLRADHLGLYGYDRFTSPTLDLLAAGGTVFTDASSTSPWTLPAHASMLTGRYPIEHRVVQFDSALPKDVASLAKIFSEHGYRTAAVVNSTWLKQEPYRLTRDFDEYLFVDDPMDRRGPNTWITDQA